VNLSTADISDGQLQVEELPVETGESAIAQDISQPSLPTGFEVIQDIMGIAHPSDEQRDKLQYIWDYFSKGRDRAEGIDAMRAAQRRLGAPDIGETYLHKLFAYTRVLDTIRGAQKEAKAYEKDIPQI
jgi:hypothetical protein